MRDGIICRNLKILNQSAIFRRKVSNTSPPRAEQYAPFMASADFMTWPRWYGPVSDISRIVQAQSNHQQSDLKVSIVPKKNRKNIGMRSPCRM
jgi:hypothetical protein